MKRWLMFWFFAPRSQRYFWTKEWQAGEREADRQFASGEYEHISPSDPLPEWLSAQSDNCSPIRLFSGSSTEPTNT